MASKKGLKKHFRVELNNFASKVYFPLLEGSDKQQEEADALLDKAAGLLEDFSAKANTCPKDKKEVGKHYASLRAEFNKEVDELHKGLSSVLGA